MAITKSNGNYFTEVDWVWFEALQLGQAAYFVGQWRGKFKLPDAPTPDVLKSLFGGTGLARVQHNRVGCFDLTFTCSKSVSIVLFALTPPSAWKQSADLIGKAATDQVRPPLESVKVNASAQGATKLPANGVGSVFTHYLSHAGDPHGHSHVAIANWAESLDGKVGSIANSKIFYEEQGVLRAHFQKSLDEHLQREGYQTKRCGKAVEVVGVAPEMIVELSTARAAMDEAKKQKGFSGPQAADFYARQARCEVPPGNIGPIEPHHARWDAVAKQHGVTRESLRTGDDRPLIADPAVRRYAAFCTARDAIQVCSQKNGPFTAAQYRETVHLLGIGRPTTCEALDREASKVLSRRKYAGVRRIMVGVDDERFTTRAGLKKQQASQRSFAAEAFDELKKATEWTKTAFIKTASAAADVFRRLKGSLAPSTTILRLDGWEAARFLETHNPTHALIAHAKAIVKGLFARENPHQRAGAPNASTNGCGNTHGFPEARSSLSTTPPALRPPTAPGDEGRPSRPGVGGTQPSDESGEDG